MSRYASLSPSARADYIARSAKRVTSERARAKALGKCRCGDPQRVGADGQKRSDCEECWQFWQAKRAANRPPIVRKPRPVRSPPEPRWRVPSPWGTWAPIKQEAGE